MVSNHNQQLVSKRPTSLGRAIPVRQGPKEALGLYLPLNGLDLQLDVVVKNQSAFIAAQGG